MILADKIIRLRKKNGWSQEELAERMQVSRQAVSKWESAQTVPNLEKILQLGELFGVTTDYLLKDEMENEEFTEGEEESNIKRITLAEANDFLEWRKEASVKIAAGVFLCIMASIPLLILGAASEVPAFGISENVAAVIGVSVLLITVAAAVTIFVSCEYKNSPFDFIDKEPFETEYGVMGMVRERQKAYKNIYAKYNIIGTCICVISPIPLLLGSMTEDDFFAVVMLCVMLFFIAVGVTFFVIAGERWSSMQKLLQEGEFAPKEKEKSKRKEVIGSIYWLMITAIYIGWSFLTNRWGITWVIWPVAGILFAVVMNICNLFIED